MELNQSQRQTVSVQMIQSMKILQMGIQELREFIGEALQENPALELPEPGEEPADAEDFARKLEWLEDNDSQNSYYHLQDAEGDRGDMLSNVGCHLDEEGELSWYILSQFIGTDLEPEILEGVEFLVRRLDGNGYLDEGAYGLAVRSGLSPAAVERALTELHAADPAGVGASNLSECLRLQLERRAGDHSLAVCIARDHLDDLARNRYGRISRAIGVPEEAVRTACDIIRGLNPKPGAAFAAPEKLLYMIPDVRVETFPGHLELSGNDTALPRLKLSPYYGRLLKETDNQEVRSYLVQKIAQAKWIIRSVEQRRSTLIRCARWIVERQEDFFRYGPSGMRPLTMGDAARELGIHESTVSRTVKGKYLQCGRGVYPLSYFFSRALGPGEASPQAAKAMLKKLVEGEEKPLSDQKLCDEMSRRGVFLSRRTVAKYREELGIPSAAGRRR